MPFLPEVQLSASRVTRIWSDAYCLHDLTLRTADRSLPLAIRRTTSHARATEDFGARHAQSPRRLGVQTPTKVAGTYKNMHTHCWNLFHVLVAQPPTLGHTRVPVRRNGLACASSAERPRRAGNPGPRCGIREAGSTDTQDPSGSAPGRQPLVRAFWESTAWFARGLVSSCEEGDDVGCICQKSFPELEEG